MTILRSSLPRLFGRRQGRPLRIRKARLIAELLPEILIRLPEDGTISPHNFFKAEQGKTTWLEIGFGSGEHLATQAQINPDIHLIGCEPFRNGVAGLLDRLDKTGTKNIRIFNDDARLVLDALADATIDKCFILFADPWPKKRHAERRFVGPDNLVRLARVLKSGAILRLASDHPQLVQWTRECLSLHQDFICVYASDVAPADWIQTRYQEKAVKAGRSCFFMDYRRK